MIANRVTSVLAWAGVFVAMVLTYSHFAERAVPCGMSHGCDTIAQHPTSKWFNVPVAMVGLVGYLLLAGLAAARPYMDKKKWRLLTNFSLAGTGFGFLASVYFMYTAVRIVQATCLWCVASAIIMTASLIVTGWLWSSDPPEPKKTKFDTVLPVAAAILALGSTTAVAASMDRALDVNQVTIGSIKESEILPPKAKLRGNTDAKVRVIEFADFNCPACRSAAPEMDEIYRKAGGRILWGFRNMPLTELKGHETSIHAAAISELAAEKGVFWQFFDSAYNQSNTERIKTLDGLKQVALESGLKASEIDQALTRSSQAAKDVAADMDLALRLSIDQTPTFLILADNAQPRAVSGRRLKTVLYESPYKELLWE